MKTALPDAIAVPRKGDREDEADGRAGGLHAVLLATGQLCLQKVQDEAHRRVASVTEALDDARAVGVDGGEDDTGRGQRYVGVGVGVERDRVTE